MADIEHYVETREPGHYWVKKGDGEWHVGLLQRSPFDPSELYWKFHDDDGWSPEPDGEVGPKLKPPK